MRRFSLRLHVVAVFGVLISAVALFMVEFFPARMAEQAQASTVLRAHTVTEVIASAVAPALEFDDAANASKILAWLASTPDARFAVVLGDGGRRFAAWGAERVPERLPAQASEIDGNLLVTSAPVIGRGGGRGTLYIGQSLDRLVEARDAARKTVVTATFIVFVIGLIACIVLATALVRPLERLTTIARDITRGAKPPRIAEVSGGREVMELTSALGMMLERLNEANRQLVEASRRAGMAEVATGMLHNVGNILTSVNVGIAALDERVGELPADRVRRAGELLAGIVDGGADPARLAVAVRYLTALADHLTGDRATLRAELATLRDHVDHISRVVTTQNDFARAGGVEEPVELATLVDEAVNLGCPGAGRHGLEVVKRVEPGRVVPLDRHRVLQILVNLLVNARDAISELRRATPGPSRITVSAALEAGWIEIRVEDTGGGIAPELALRIFNAGFTTKPKGHGYGLHSSALAAEQMGGTLRCTSPGVGQGATFLLRVPTETASRHAE